MRKGVRGKLARVIDGETIAPAPIWLMRQAGRYLPEYRKLRDQAGSFWSLCMTSIMASEVTLQPIQRFDFDAAIVFSDILVVPHALGKRVDFEDGIGPRVEAVRSPSEVCVDESVWLEKLAPVYETLRRVAADLPEEKDLIGFAGGPWTLAAYMIGGRGSPDQAAAKLWAYRDKKGFYELLSIIAECVVVHLCAQIEAGATVVQLFDSWAGGLNEGLFQECVVGPSRHVVAEVRRRKPEARIIGFPRGATERGYVQYLAASSVDAISIDTAVSVNWAAENLGSKAALQGNLDPFVLAAGGGALDTAVNLLLREMQGTRHIINLGHGVLPETPVENVTELVRLVRSTQ